MPKAKKVKKKHDSYRTYFDSLDLSEWWDEFANTFEKNGTQKFQTVYSFIKTKTKDKKKRDFLWWILGPKLEDTTGHALANYSQYDWQEKRERGFWHSSANVEELRKTVKRQHSSLEQVRELGKVNIDFLATLKNVSDQIDREYNGQIFLKSLSAKENAARARLYIELKKDLSEMIKEVQLVFAKTQGVDMERIEGMLQIIGPAMMQRIFGVSDGEQEPQGRGGLQDVAGKLTKMLMNKAVDYEMTLPDESMNTAVTKEAPVLINVKKNNKVN